MLQLETNQKLQWFPGSEWADAQWVILEREPLILTSQVRSNIQKQDCSSSRIVVEPVPTGLFDLHLLYWPLPKLYLSTMLLVHNYSIPDMCRPSVQLYLLALYHRSNSNHTVLVIWTTNFNSSLVLQSCIIQWMDLIALMWIKRIKNGCEGRWCVYATKK